MSDYEWVSEMNRERAGDQNPNAKLTDAQARDIRYLRAAGMLIRDLTEMFGVSQTTIMSITHGLSYIEAGGPVEAPHTQRHRGIFAEHGTCARYNRGCRCADCTKANSDKSRAWWAQKRAEHGHA